MTLRPFHLAIPVDDLAAARAFYGGTIGCAEGRSSDEWIDFDFFGHQLVVHGVAGQLDGLTPDPSRKREEGNSVDGHDVPVPHFGVVLTLAQFDALAARLSEAGMLFVHPPMTRFAGQAGEQKTMFLRDPAGNALEFKAFGDDAMLFAR